MKRLDAVDDVLEELGSLKTYRKLQTRMKWTIVGWIVYCCLVNINDMIWCYFEMKDRRTLILPHITNHFRHVNTFMELSFVHLYGV